MGGFDPFGWGNQFTLVNQQLAVIRALLRQLLAQEAKMAHSLDEVLAGVADESTKEDGLIALVTGLSAQVKELLASAKVPADVQAKIDAVFDAVAVNSGKVQEAIDANVVAAQPWQRAPVTP